MTGVRSPLEPAVEDFGERVAICVESGVPLERARRIAAVQLLSATETPADGAARASGQPNERTPHRGAQAPQGARR